MNPEGIHRQNTFSTPEPSMSLVVDTIEYAPKNAKWNPVSIAGYTYERHSDRRTERPHTRRRAYIRAMGGIGQKVDDSPSASPLLQCPQRLLEDSQVRAARESGSVSLRSDSGQERGGPLDALTRRRRAHTSAQQQEINIVRTTSRR